LIRVNPRLTFFENRTVLDNNRVPISGGEFTQYVRAAERPDGVFAGDFGWQNVLD
jgi:hypothetical protein